MKNPPCCRHGRNTGLRISFVNKNQSIALPFRISVPGISIAEQAPESKPFFRFAPAKSQDMSGRGSENAAFPGFFRSPGASDAKPAKKRLALPPFLCYDDFRGIADHCMRKRGEKSNEGKDPSQLWQMHRSLRVR